MFVGHYTNADDIDSMKPVPAFARAPVVALLGAAIVLALQGWPGANVVLEYQVARNAAEPWRLLTAHVVHVNARHALVNAVAWIALARLFAPELPVARQLFVLLAGAVGVSLGLALFYPAIAWYRGLSGVLHALYFAGAGMGSLRARSTRTRAMALGSIALFVAGVIKVASEQPQAGATPFAGWLGAPVVPQAHLIGAVCGTLAALCFSAYDAGRDWLSRRRAV